MGEGAMVEMRGITKRFPGVTANAGVDFTAFGGELHALVGENGAGKTTLMRTLYGMHAPDSGEIRLFGNPVRISSPRDAISHGIGMVHQRFMLVPALTVLDNLILGDEPATFGRTDYRSARVRMTELCERFDFQLDPSTRVDGLSASGQQKLEILKALYRGARILILDEPTSVLSPQEADGLFRVLHRMAGEGMCVILISHKLRDVIAHSAKVTVLRQGRSIASCPTSETDADALAALMVGSRAKATEVDRRGVNLSGEVLLAIGGLRVRSGHGLPAVDDVDLDVRRGEIVGIAGVDGNGQRELAEAIVGLRASSGSVRLGSTEVGGMTVRRRLESGIAYIPESHSTAFAQDFPLTDNAILGRHRSAEFAHAGVTRPRAIREFAAEVVADYGVRAAGLETPVRSLSGGNQQKLVLGRTLSGCPNLLVACQPTQGLDVASSAEVHNRVVECAQSGAGVILVSHDLDEIMELSDRIVVMFKGRIAGTLSRAEATRERIGALMMGAAQ